MNIAMRIPAVTVWAIGGLLAFASSARSAAADPAAFSSCPTPAPVRTELASHAAVMSMSWRSKAPISMLNRRPRHDQGRPPSADDGGGGRGYTEFHGGFQEPNGNSGTQTLFGARLAALVGPHVAIGGMIDWSHRGDSVTEVISSTPGPGGTTIVTQREYARSSADLVPMLGFLHFSADNRRSLVPYAGIAGGYELLFLSADDLTTGAQYDATFGGWGWQACGGLAIRLSDHARLSTEVFRNFGDLSRDTEDLSGYTVREKVNVEATGMRFGLSFGY